MSIITGHWSGTRPLREEKYHLEFAQKVTPLPASLLTMAQNAKHAKDVHWNDLFAAFTVWKNVNFDTAMDFGTFGWNHDFRDHSPNIEIAAMCMGGPHVSTQHWGEWPYTKAHALMHAYLMAAVCKLKNINPLDHFEPIDGYMNGPLYAVSTHGERAYQTKNPPIDTSSRGYGLYGQDPDCRWDLAILEEHDQEHLRSYDLAHTAATVSANWLRAMVSEIKTLPDFHDHWNLDHSV